jgi:hypothetical protein
MIRTAAVLMAPVRPALVMALVGLASLLTASLATPSMSAQSVAVLATLAAATAAVLVARRLAVLPAPAVRMRPTRWADEVLPHLAGRSTDVVHRPHRPRAPGAV